MLGLVRIYPHGTMTTVQRFALPLLLSVASFAAVTPNPRVSLGKALQASPSANASLLNDGKFGNAWNYSAGSWAAIQVGAGPSKVLVTWNEVSGNWSDKIPSTGACPSGVTFPTAYRILASANSTDGSNGTWDTLVRVTGNLVGSRTHALDFTGKSWVKMLVVAGSGRMDELEVFDASNGREDAWFFMGTSITMMTYKSNIPDSSFSDMIHALVPANTPSIVRGGTGCINSTQVLASIRDYLDQMGDCHFLAIEMATNDVWGGGDWNYATYIRNMQAIIDSAKGRGLVPIVARPMATDSARAGWQVNPIYVAGIDSLVRVNKLIAGPDLNGWFRAHPEQLGSDGVHPAVSGSKSLVRLWAETMRANVYATSSGVAPRVRPVRAEGASHDALGRPRNGSVDGVELDAWGAKVRLRSAPQR